MTREGARPRARGAVPLFQGTSNWRSSRPVPCTLFGRDLFLFVSLGVAKFFVLVIRTYTAVFVRAPGTTMCSPFRVSARGTKTESITELRMIPSSLTEKRRRAIHLASTTRLRRPELTTPVLGDLLGFVGLGGARVCRVQTCNDLGNAPRLRCSPPTSIE